MKPYFWISLVLSILVTIGCGKETPPMRKELVVNILMDVHIAESLISSHHPSIMKDSLEKRYLLQVLDKWNTSKLEFEGAMNHMHSDPDYMRDVYDAVQNQINEYSENLDQQDTDTKAKKIEKLKKKDKSKELSQ